MGHTPTTYKTIYSTSFPLSDFRSQERKKKTYNATLGGGRTREFLQKKKKWVGCDKYVYKIDTDVTRMSLDL